MEDTAVAIQSQTDAVERDYDDDEERESVALFDFRMAAFTLAGKDYAIDIMNVKEIVKASRFTYVPNTVPFVLGVYNLRGEIIPIIDLRKFFNIEVPKRKDDQIENLLIITIEDHVFGVVVDQIEGIVGIQKSSIQPPHPLFGDINIKFIYGIVEARDRLYVLLDIARIFNQKPSGEEEDRFESAPQAKEVEEASQQDGVPSVPPEANPDHIDERSGGADEEEEAQKAASASAPPQASAEDPDRKFIVDGLKQFKKFYIDEVNKSWFENRFSEWKAERPENVQLSSAADADEFLKTFWSSNSGAFWTKEYADAVYSILPDNAAKQIYVWNPGCGKGHESFSLACVLKRRYPQSKIRIYAHETDLLNIANAPLISVPDSEASGWLSPYLQKGVTGEYTFTQEIKDIIMFEYHDINNANALPMTDIIFARDVLSLLPPEGQKSVLVDFEEKLKGNGILFLGENEGVGSGMSWGEKTQGQLTYYSKQ